MAILKILKYPEPALKKVALPVRNFDAKIVQLVNDMLETMYAAPGVGLAAPQVGVSSASGGLDTNHENPGQQVYKLINPVITHAEGSVIWEEGCLSVVDFTADVKRASQVQVGAFDEQQKRSGSKLKVYWQWLCSMRSIISMASSTHRPDQSVKARAYSRKRVKILRSGIEPAHESAHIMI